MAEKVNKAFSVLAKAVIATVDSDINIFKNLMKIHWIRCTSFMQIIIQLNP